MSQYDEGLVCFYRIALLAVFTARKPLVREENPTATPHFPLTSSSLDCRSAKPMAPGLPAYMS